MASGSRTSTVESLKRPWSDGTSSIDLAPLALIARLAALIPSPRRHVVRYTGVISSHSSLRSQIVPVPAVATPEGKDKPSLPISHYISWSDLLRRTFEIDTICPACKSPLRLIALIKTDDTIKKILSAMALPCSFGALGLPALPPLHGFAAPVAEAPKLWPARPPPSQSGGEGGDWLN